MPRQSQVTPLAGPRRSGKSDPLDAIEAALSGRASGAGKSRDENVEALRPLLVAKRSARSAKVQTAPLRRALRPVHRTAHSHLGVPLQLIG